MIFRLFLFFFFAFHAHAELRTKFGGEVSLEGQTFEEDQKSQTQDSNLAVKGALEFKAKKNHFQIKVKGFARKDLEDQDRNIEVLEELWLAFKKESFQLKMGYQIINWSATEAFHPADGINSRNFDSDAQNAEKIGELILRPKWIYGQGSLSYLYMPTFSNPHFPPSSSRLGAGSSSISLQTPRWTQADGSSSQSRFVFQQGIVWEHNFDDIDLSFHYLDHIDRNHPVFVILNPLKTSEITPLYLRTKQYGLTYQHALDGYLIKLAAAYFDFKDFKDQYIIASGYPQDHLEFAPGLEYNTSFENGAELTTLLEYQRYFNTDAKYDDNYLFQNDLLMGLRYAFNDEIGTELFFSIIYDLAGRQETFYSLDYSRRIGNYWKFKLGMRYIDAPKTGTGTAQGLEQIANSDRLYFNITRYF